MSKKLNITLTLREYMENKEKYSHYGNEYIYVKTKPTNKKKKRLTTSPSFLGCYIPDTPIIIDGEEHIIPTYITNNDLYLNKYKADGYTLLDNCEIIIDVEKYNNSFDVPRQISKGTIINIHDYVETDNQHWFNKQVLKFYKTQHNSGVIITAKKDITECKNIFKALTSESGGYIDYRKLTKLFSMTGHNEESFKNFVLKNKGE